MTYQVLARKWRPQGLDALIGQAHVARTLRNAVESGRFAHAYLFAGVRGTGKTTVARILAKCLNCEQGPTATPCHRCASCAEIAESRSLDVLEIDAASRTGIDDVRELQEVVAYSPVRDRYRVLIIDEAHMLSKAAFNALLKTLEEPPPRVVFVLATTEIQKVLPTILSRCQVFEFRRVPAREVSAHLRRVCDEEGVRISDASIERVALAGEGSVRDSLSVLERMLAFCGPEVSDEDALRLLGSAKTEVLAAFVRAIQGRDAAALLGAVDRVLADGLDLLHFWSELIGVVRDLMLLRTVESADDLVLRSPEELRVFLDAAEGLSLDDLSRVFHVLADLEFGLKSSSHPRFLFEAALIRIARLGAVAPIERWLAALGPESGAGAPPRPPPREAAIRSVATRPEAPAPGPAVDASTGSREIARDLVVALQERRPSIAAILGTPRRAEVSGATLRLELDAVPDMLRRTIERDDSLRAIEEVAASIVGSEVRLELVFVPASARAPQSAPSSTRSAPVPTAKTQEPPDDPQPERIRSSLIDEVRREPGMQKLLREFGAQVIDVRSATPESAPDGPTDSGLAPENPE